MTRRLPRNAGAAILAVVAMGVAFPAVLATVAAGVAVAPPSLRARTERFPPVTDTRAAFEQEREVSLVDEVLRASGTIAFRAPDHMRLELTAPERMTIAVDGDALTVLDANGAPIAVPPEFAGFGRFGHVLTDLVLGARGPEQFEEEWHGADAVTLRTSDPASPFTDIALRFPPDAPLPTEIVLRERGGDRTTIHMRALPDAAPTPAPPPRPGAGGARPPAGATAPRKTGATALRRNG